MIATLPTIDTFSRPTRYRKALHPEVADTLRQALAVLKPFLPWIELDWHWTPTTLAALREKRK